MDQKQLSYFIAVAKYRNFSGAAQDFYLTQPAISHQIKMLEKEQIVANSFSKMQKSFWMLWNMQSKK